MALESSQALGTCLYRPAVSADGSLLAVVRDDFSLQILHLAGNVCKVVCQTPLPRAWHDFLSQLTILKWSPGVPSKDGDGSANHKGLSLPHLMLSDGSRLLSLNPNAMLDGSAPHPSSAVPKSTYIVADYHLGNQLGGVSYADFLLGDAYALVLFERGHASLLSLTGPQREDIQSIKFCNHQSVATAPNGRSQALLLRSKGQDQVMVLVMSADGIKIQSTFPTHTSDAQGLAWSPDGDPVISVWDSAAYDFKMSFFSALGHPLKQLEISALTSSDVQAGVGLTAVEWAKHDDETVLAVADGHKQTIIRHQHHKTMKIRPGTPLRHPSTIDGAKAIVWQQSTGGDHAFHLEKGAFDATFDPTAGSDTTCISFNCDRTFIATTVADNVRAVWLWQPEHSEPHTIIVFQHNVRQILWHPWRSGVLLVMTVQKPPIAFGWYAETKPPLPCIIPLESPSSKFEATWLNQEAGRPCPLLITTPRAFNAGIVGATGNGLAFDSLLQRSESFRLLDDDMTGIIDTPSRPGRTKFSVAATNFVSSLNNRDAEDWKW